LAARPGAPTESSLETIVHPGGPPMFASLRRFAGLVLLWSIPGVAVGLQSKAWESTDPAKWGTHRFLWFYFGWVICACLIPPLAWLVRKVTVERYGLWRVAAAHVLNCAVFVVFQETCVALLSRVAGPFSMRQLPLGAAILDSVTASAFLDTLVYVMSVGVLLAVALRRRIRAEGLDG